MVRRNPAVRRELGGGEHPVRHFLACRRALQVVEHVRRKALYRLGEALRSVYREATKQDAAMPQQAVAQPCAGGGDPLPQVHARLARADDAQVVVGRVEQAFLHQVAGRELPGRRRGALNEALMRHLRSARRGGVGGTSAGARLEYGVDMMVRIRRGPRNGSRPCWASMLSRISTSPTRQSKRRVSRSMALRMVARVCASIGLPSP